jgi:hypothetical protein
VKINSAEIKNPGWSIGVMEYRSIVIRENERLFNLSDSTLQHSSSPSLQAPYF